MFVVWATFDGKSGQCIQAGYANCSGSTGRDQFAEWAAAAGYTGEVESHRWYNPITGGEYAILSCCRLEEAAIIAANTALKCGRVGRMILNGGDEISLYTPVTQGTKIA